MSEVVLGAASTASPELSAQTSVSPNTVVVMPTPQNKQDLPATSQQQQQRPSQEAPLKQQETQQNTEVNKNEEQKQPLQDEKTDSPVFEVAGLDMTELSKEYETTGTLSEESYKELEENGFSKDVVDAYIRGVKMTASSEGELAQKDVDNILSEVGGLAKYEQVMSWASTKLSQEEQESYNRAVTGKDSAVARLVVQGLMSRYEKEYGRNPDLVSGDRAASPDGTSGFSSRSDMIAAMSDSRYGKDPNYTREVESKVIRSGIMRGKR